MEKRIWLLMGISIFFLPLLVVGKTITDNSTGGDCTSVGNWVTDTKTCSLNTDLSESIFINSGVTLNGNNHKVLGSYAIPFGVTMENGTTLKNITVKGFSNGIYPKSDSIIENVEITGNNYGIYLINGANNNTIKGSHISGGFYGIYSYFSDGNTFENNIFDKIINTNLNLQFSDNLVIKGNTFVGKWGNVRLEGVDKSQIYNNNFFSGNERAIVRYEGYGNVFNLEPPIGGNYWENYDEPNEGCVDDNNDKFCDSQFMIDELFSSYDNFPFAKSIGQPEPPEAECCSNVLFLPGFMASDLYSQESFFENQLWPPTSLLKTDIQKLMLDSNGNPITSGIYTKNIMSEAFGSNIYKSFIEKMNAMVANKDIKEWEGFPYDWRKDISEVVNEDTVIKIGDNFENRKLIDEAIALAQRSPTGKITIVGHSNGGLVGKHLIKELANQDKVNIVDKFIMVATPQIGTPKAVAGLLHGDGQTVLYGLLLDKESARSLGYNMQSAYNLLPTQSYFNNIYDPVIKFEDSISSVFNYSASGLPKLINTFDNVFNFITSNNRGIVLGEPTNIPSSLRVDFVNNANMNIDALANWQIPSNVKVFEMAGWGESTIKGIDYKSKKETVCYTQGGLNICQPQNVWDREFLMTDNGDGTVVVTSSTNYDTPNKYYINLFDLNEARRFNLKHHNILEASQLLETLSKIFTNNLGILPGFIYTQKPVSINQTLQLSVHSPVSLDVTNSEGRYTGPSSTKPTDALTFIKEEIPNSYYLEIGEDKYIGLPKDGNYTINIQGNGIGSFTFNQEITQGSQIIDSRSFVNIPVTPVTKISLSVNNGSLSDYLDIDVDGNGSVDVQILAGNEFSPIAYLSVMKSIIISFGLERHQETDLMVKIDNIIKYIQSGNKQKAAFKTETLVKKLNLKLDKVYNGLSEQKKLTEEEMSLVIKNLDEFINNLE